MSTDTEKDNQEEIDIMNRIIKPEIDELKNDIADLKAENCRIHARCSDLGKSNLVYIDVNEKLTKENEKLKKEKEALETKFLEVENENQVIRNEINVAREISHTKKKQTEELTAGIKAIFIQIHSLRVTHETYKKKTFAEFDNFRKDMNNLSRLTQQLFLNFEAQKESLIEKSTNATKLEEKYIKSIELVKSVQVEVKKLREDNRTLRQKKPKPTNATDKRNNTIIRVLEEENEKLRLALINNSIKNVKEIQESINKF